MTNEVKEILEFLKHQVNYDDINLMQKRASNITYYDIKQLLDYITNLQEENERLKNLYTNEKSHKIDYDYIKMLYSKIDKDSVIDDLVYKSEQCRVLYDSAEKHSFENYDLQQRIDKAIEYIENDYDKNEELIEYFNYDGNFNELLKILKGEE